MDEYLGTIKAFGFNFAPKGWAQCQGQLLPIVQNQALYSLLGTTYGGDGQSTFALPDLRGRANVGVGQGPGLSNYTQGQQSGSENVTLTVNNLPSHSHALNAYSETGNVGAPAGALPAATGSLDPEYRTQGTLVPMAANAVGAAGNNQPVSVMQPYLVLNYCICLQGLYPSRP